MESSINVPVLESGLDQPSAPIPVQDAPAPPSKLMNWNFVLLWQGQFISKLGGQFYSIMLVFWLKHATDSASVLGLLALLNSVPSILLSGLGGVLADRYSRRQIIIVSDLLRGILIFSVAGLLYLTPSATTTLVAWFIIVSMSTSIAGMLSQPAMLAAFPDLVPKDKVARANSLRNLTGPLSVIMGQGLGGVFYTLLGAPVVALINGVSFLIAAASKWWIEIPQEIPKATNTWQEEFVGVKKEIIAGFRYTWNTVALRTLFVTSASLNFFITPILILLPFYIEDFLQVSLEWYGFMLAVYGVGIAVGTLSAGYLKLQAKLRGWLTILFVFLIAAGAIVMGFIHTPMEASIVALIIGAMNGFNSVNVFTVIQLTTSTEMRGRVLGFLNTLSASTGTLGMGFGGVLYDLSGQNLPLIFSICGVLMMVIMAIAVLKKEFREVLAYEPA